MKLGMKLGAHLNKEEIANLSFGARSDTKGMIDGKKSSGRHDRQLFEKPIM